MQEKKFPETSNKFTGEQKLKFITRFQIWNIAWTEYNTDFFFFFFFFLTGNRNFVLLENFTAFLTPCDNILTIFF